MPLSWFVNPLRAGALVSMCLVGDCIGEIALQRALSKLTAMKSECSIIKRSAIIQPIDETPASSQFYGDDTWMIILISRSDVSPIISPMHSGINHSREKPTRPPISVNPLTGFPHLDRHICLYRTRNKNFNYS